MNVTWDGCGCVGRGFLLLRRRVCRHMLMCYRSCRITMVVLDERDVLEPHPRMRHLKRRTELSGADKWMHTHRSWLTQGFRELAWIVILLSPTSSDKRLADAEGWGPMSTLRFVEQNSLVLHFTVGPRATGQGEELLTSVLVRRAFIAPMVQLTRPSCASSASMAGADGDVQGGAGANQPILLSNSE